MGAFFGRHKFIIFLILFVAAFGFFHNYPINSLFFRLSYIAIILFLIFGTLIFSWRNYFLRYSILVILLLLSIFIILPEKPYYPERLRSSYLKSLRGFECVGYLWGGENEWGIDCSGLLRKAYVNTMREEGLLTLNPKLIKEAFNQWWYDRTAKMMSDEFRDETILVAKAKNINELDHSLILPGDLAITKSGVHALAYLGKQEWIQADPKRKKVVIDTIPGKSTWLQTPINIVRWRFLLPTK